MQVFNLADVIQARNQIQGQQQAQKLRGLQIQAAEQNLADIALGREQRTAVQGALPGAFDGDEDALATIQANNPELYMGLMKFREARGARAANELAQRMESLDRSALALESLPDDAQRTEATRALLASGRVPQQDAQTIEAFLANDGVITADEVRQYRIARTGMIAGQAQSMDPLTLAKLQSELMGQDTEALRQADLVAKMNARDEDRARASEDRARTRSAQDKRAASAISKIDNLLGSGPDGIDPQAVANRLDKAVGSGTTFLRDWAPAFLGSEAFDIRADIDQIVSVLALAARGELKGQGPITEGEQAMLNSAITALKNPNISPSKAMEELINVRGILDPDGTRSIVDQVSGIQGGTGEAGLDALLEQYAPQEPASGG